MSVSQTNTIFTYRVATHSSVIKNWCFASNLAIPSCQEWGFRACSRLPGADRITGDPILVTDEFVFVLVSLLLSQCTHCLQGWPVYTVYSVNRSDTQLINQWSEQLQSQHNSASVSTWSGHHLKVSGLPIVNVITTYTLTDSVNILWHLAKFSRIN